MRIIKKYKINAAPKFYDKNEVEIKGKHTLKQTLEEILSNKPFYITPSMMPADINELIQEIYTEVLKSDLQKIEEAKEGTELEKLAKEYTRLKRSYPEFIQKLKSSTDILLDKVSNDVSQDLQSLFSNKEISLTVSGGESDGFSASDVLKTTDSSVNIDSNGIPNMPLSNQGTGLQRMSLISLIQNLIKNKMLGNNSDKLLLIDEPEAFLHPEAVRSLSRSLYEIGLELPLIISTHSPVLINLDESHSSIQLFRVGNTKAIEIYKSTNEKFTDDDIENMKILNYVDSHVNEFFFADKIIIVEGDTEYIAFKYFSEKYKDNVHIVRARGKGTIVTLMKILNQFKASYDVLHDIDNKEDFKPSTLKAQRTNCRNIFSQKLNEDIRVFASVSNFEDALELGEVSNANKTKVIYQILHETEDKQEYAKARKYIEELYLYIISNEANGTLNDNFKVIKDSDEYNSFFDDLIGANV